LPFVDLLAAAFDGLFCEILQFFKNRCALEAQSAVSKDEATGSFNRPLTIPSQEFGSQAVHPR
jgi:hypothetical protein